MNKLLSRTSLLALATVPWIGQAHAEACSPANPVDGDTITCAATGAGILDDGLDDLSITVTATGDVQGGADAAFEVKDDLVLTNDGAISSVGSAAILVDDEAQITNNGTITSTDDRGIDGDEGITVVNHGTITAWDDDGININEDATVTNYGTINAGSQSINVADNSVVTNYGVLNSLGEGIEGDGDSVTVLNEGEIYSIDDAINVGENAMVTNNGLLEVSGDQDGIDIDSGTIINNGTIRALGSEDGVDYDPSTVASSTLTNYGEITGNMGVNVDSANTMGQTVINYGTITGTGGTAIYLGDGDDTLSLQGGSISGDVDLGDGSDTLIVGAGVSAGTLSFVSAPEVIDMAEAPDTALFAGTTLVVADAEAFSSMDYLAALGSRDIGRALSAVAYAPGWWGDLSGWGGDLAHGGALTVGRDFDAIGVFVRASNQDMTSDNGATDLERRSIALGLRKGFALGQGFDGLGFAYIASGATDLTSALDAAGTGSTDSREFGIGMQVAQTPVIGRIDLSGSLGASWARYDGFALSGLGGAGFEDRDAGSYYLTGEIGYSLATGVGALRPFGGIDLITAQGDAVTMGLAGASTQFDVEDDDLTLYRIGAELTLTNGALPIDLRLETAFDGDGNMNTGLGLSMRF
ncbi:hypothetical protein [Pseudooceanicola algae]|uniref:Autotransporter domain-containing protein n=1 Tax=Pseudooceanicola algae TaxID=1537215 RepID=A0A418SEN6_9RHOB|nr:hypothetical protein [Pseudooceanicola algae]QPM89662.1 hypothetical protein PSAL_008870 [Pseudooceanicola algae]